MKALSLVLMGLILSSCAGMMEDYKANTCNYNGGYEKGVNDAQSGTPSQTQKVTYYCDANAKDETARGYREGYMTIKQTPQININTMGRSNNVRRCVAHSGQEAHEAFCNAQNNLTCSVHSMCSFQ